ncbi:MAG: lycopene cyclase domain-containing protein [Ignavibacteria bacterium]|nr:lycopene cyclase domain-containing protein [Ignavibacteria bacterium]
MSEYLLINLLIVAVPLIFSFEKNLRYHTKFKYVFLSILFTAFPFIIWDAAATNRGDWSFNKEFVQGFHISGLPFEEILFFITVPYSIIFIYETVNFYIDERNYKIHKIPFFLLFASLLIVAVFNAGKFYTCTVFLFSAGIISADFFYFKVLSGSVNFLITLVISYIPFFIVNYFLTSLPIVEYNPSAFSGIRITTIPVEDFVYSFALISWYVSLYAFFKKRFAR